MAIDEMAKVIGGDDNRWWHVMIMINDGRKESERWPDKHDINRSVDMFNRNEK